MKMKSVYVKSNTYTYIDYSKKINKTHPKFKVGDNAIISKYKDVFAKVTLQIDLKKSL